MIEKPRILYVHNASELPENRLKCYASLKKEASEIDYISTFSKGYKRTIIDKLLNKLKLPTDPCDLNKRLIIKIQTFKPDLAFIVKGVNIKPQTLKVLSNNGIKTVSWSNDDMYGWHNRSIYYSLGLKYYNLVVTQKSYNCNPNELPSLGVKKILFQDKAFDPAMHYPIDDCMDCKYKFDVLFIGTYEKERFEMLKFLADNDIVIHIIGWAKKMSGSYHKNLIFNNLHLYGSDYAGAFACSKISLNFLRKQSRDLQTSRSIEIPACRGFMLAERTDEHLRLFDEGKEAEFFSTKEELLQKVKYYLEHDAERNKIAEAGYLRCYKSDYSFDNRMKEIIKVVFG